MKRVIIVGGGYAGAGLARALDRLMDVRLIEPRDAFVHNIGAIRAVVQPALLSRIVIPYDRLLRRGQMIRGRASGIDARGVILADGTAIEGDMVVLATGSTYNAPFKPGEDQTGRFIAAATSINAALGAAGSIAIVGGGPVGVELAGEIATRFPDKRLTLIGRAGTLCPGFNPALGARLAAQLTARGIALHLGTGVVDLPAGDAPFGPAILTLTDGNRIEADLVFPVAGARPTTELARSLPDARFDAAGRLVVDAWGRPAEQHNLFALGDLAATGDPMTAIGITRQIPWAVKMLRAVADGTPVEKTRPYKPWPSQPLIVPIGPRGGASILPVTGAGLVVGSFLTSTFKGKELLVGRYRREMGYPAGE